jgi:MFS family permease
LHTSPPVAAAPSERGRWAIFSALRHRNYRFYWVAQFPSVLAQNMQHVALAWLVLQMTNSPAMLGITGLTHVIPNVLLTLLGGALADRMDRKRLLLATQGGTAFLFFVLGTLVVTEAVQVWQVLVMAFLLGGVRAFDHPARAALLPMVVPIEEIPNAVPLGNIVWSGTRLVGPAAAALLIAFVGIGQTFYVASAFFIVAMALFVQIRIAPFVAEQRQANLLRDIAEGLSYIRRNQVVAALIGLVFFDSIFGLSFTIMLPVFARDILQVGVQGLGLLEFAAAAGALGVTFVIAALARAKGNGWRILSGGAAFGLLIIVFAYSESFLLSLVVLFLMGAANQVYMTLANTSLQLILPNEFRGRVMGLWGLTWSLMPLGGAMAGGIAEYWGAPLALAIGGALVTLFAVVMAVTLPRVREL